MALEDGRGWKQQKRARRNSRRREAGWWGWCRTISPFFVQGVDASFAFLLFLISVLSHTNKHTHTHLLKLFLSPSPPFFFSFASFLAPSLTLCYSHFCTQSPPPSSLLPSFQFYPSSLPISFLLLVPYLFYALYCPALSPPCISSSTLFSIISPSSTTPFSSFSCCPPPSPPRPPFPR